MMDQSRSQESINEALDEPISELMEVVTAEVSVFDEEMDGCSEVDKLEHRAAKFVASKYNYGNSKLQVPLVLYSLSKRMYKQYENSRGDSELIKTAVICCRTALKLGDGSLDHINPCYYLGLMLKDQFEHTGEREDLDEAIEVMRTVLALSEGGGEEQLDLRLTALDNLADVLERRYTETKNLCDLDEAVKKAEMAVNSTTDPIKLAVFQGTLSQVFDRRYEHTLNISDLDRAIAAATQVVRFVPEHPEDKGTALINLILKLHRRYEQSGEISDLENAIRNARAAVQLQPLPKDLRAACLSGLSTSLGSQYKRTGNMKDLNEALNAAQKAVDLSSEREPNRAFWLNNLADKYCSRFERTGEMSDIEAAIQCAQDAVDLSPYRTSWRLDCLNTLSVSLARKYSRTDDEESLKKATKAARDAVALTEQRGEEHLDRGLWYISLGFLLQRQYEKTGDRSHIEEAVEKARRAVTLTPKHHPAHVTAVSNLGTRLSSLHKATKSLEDLKEAIKYDREALNLTPDEHIEKATRLRNLASKLRTLHGYIGNAFYEDEALSLFLKASRLHHAVPFNRIECARAAVAIIVNRGELAWLEARKLTEEALELVPLVCSRYTSREDQQHAITQVSGLAADAASLSIRSGDAEKALQQLEFGRGLILGYMIDNRSDLSALRRDHEALANCYEELRFKVSREIDNTQTAAIMRQLLRERREAVEKIDDCVLEIRKLAGHERFQMQPEMDDLKSIATKGPIVVVNVTEISADAIILSYNGIDTLRLPGLSLETAPCPIQQNFWRYKSTIRGEYDDDRKITIADKPQRGSDQFSWLWTNCVQPVLDKLGAMRLLNSTSSEPPRVWWIGSGIASSFPFHAAGVNFGNSSADNTLSRVVSSYTPTIKALAYSRSRGPGFNGPGDDKNHAILLITMPTTYGQKALPGVDKEKAAIEKATKGVYSVEELRLRTASEVLEKIPQSSITHFACHGSSDPSKPSESHMLLQKEIDGKATVDKLTMSAVSAVAAKGQLGWIAFLSACSTAEIKASHFADEGLHLASAFQIAGFPHVIGALWSVNDDICARIAEDFYTELTRSGTGKVTDRSVAMALRHAVMRVRSGPHSNPRQWAPFIHFGA